MKLSPSTLSLMWLSLSTMVIAVFEEIETDFQDVDPTGVVFPSICIGRIDVPRVMYTMETSTDNEVRVLTDPPNLMEVGIDPNDGRLFFKFVEETLDMNPSATGVIVQFPPSQLATVSICCGQNLQVQDGFTNVRELAVSGSGTTAQAIFSSQNVNMNLTVRQQATATVEITVRSGRNDIVVNGSGSGTFVDVAGDITTIECVDRATCSVAGAISNTTNSRVNGFSVLDTEDCDGISVDGGSTCDESFPFVSANVNGPLTLSGETESCVQGGDLGGNNVEDDDTTTTPTVSPAPTPEGSTPAPATSPAPTVDRPTFSPVTRPSSNSIITSNPTPTPITPSGAANSWMNDIRTVRMMTVAAIMTTTMMIV